MRGEFVSWWGCFDSARLARLIVKNCLWEMGNHVSLALKL